MKMQLPIILKLAGNYAKGELLVDGTRLQLDSQGCARIRVGYGAHYIHYVGEGAPGTKLSLQAHSEQGRKLWQKELNIPRDGLVAGTKKFRIVGVDDDDWGGYRFRG